MVYGQWGISGLSRGGRQFGGLGMQGQPNEYSVRNIFEGSFTEEVTVEGNAIFEEGFKFSASEARKKFDSAASVDQGAIGEQSGSDFWVIWEREIERSSDHWWFMINKKYIKKWMRSIYSLALCLHIKNSVELRRKYTWRSQDRQKCLWINSRIGRPGPRIVWQNLSTVMGCWWNRNSQKYRKINYL